MLLFVFASADREIKSTTYYGRSIVCTSINRTCFKVSIAVPKPGLAESNQITTTTTNEPDQQQAQYSQYYEQYWSDKAAWGNYGIFQGPGGSAARGSRPNQYFATSSRPVLVSATGTTHDFGEEEQEGDEEVVVGKLVAIKCLHRKHAQNVAQLLS